MLPQPPIPTRPDTLFPYRTRFRARRLEGASYEEIARAGGGIVATMRAVRAADEEALIAESLPRLDALIADGVTTIEIGRAHAELQSLMRTSYAVFCLKQKTEYASNKTIQK